MKQFIISCALMCLASLPIQSYGGIKITPNCPNSVAVTQAHFAGNPEIKIFPDVTWVKLGGLIFENQDWFVFVSLANPRSGDDVVTRANNVLANALVPPAQFSRNQNYTCTYDNAFDDDALIWISTSPTAPTLIGNIFGQ